MHLENIILCFLIFFYYILKYSVIFDQIIKQAVLKQRAFIYILTRKGHKMFKSNTQNILNIYFLSFQPFFLFLFVLLYKSMSRGSPLLVSQPALSGAILKPTQCAAQRVLCKFCFTLYRVSVHFLCRKIARLDFRLFIFNEAETRKHSRCRVETKSIARMTIFQNLN